MKEPFDALIPKRGWFKDYHEYTKGAVESPTVFHFFCAATILSAILGRKVWFKRGRKKKYPNLYVVLMSPTGVGRKSEAMDSILDLVKELGLIPNITNETTPESLVKDLQDTEQATALLFAREFANLMGQQDYLKHMTPRLVDFFDCPAEHTMSTKGKGRKTLRNVFISMLAASTPDWVISASSPLVLKGGFLGRLLVVLVTKNLREYPFPVEENEALRRRLQKDALGFFKIEGELVMTPETKKWYKPWYHKHRQEQPEIEEFSGYYARKPDFMFKLAVLLQIAEGGSLVITKQKLEHSLKILNFVEKRYPEICAVLFATEFGRDQQRILRQLKKEGGVSSHTELSKKNLFSLHTSERFKKVVGTLIEAEKVEVFQRKDEKGKILRGIWYRLKK